MNQQRNRIMRIGTWNIRSLNGKEIELNDEFERANLSILNITETKKKESGIMKLKGGHLLIYSGVPQNERSRAGVGCIIKEELTECIIEWTGVSERILTVTLEIDNKIMTFITAYGPNEDENANIKDEFWDKLQTTIKSQQGTIYIMGDLNARVGNNHKCLAGVMGKYGEVNRNNNGNRLIDLCIINDLRILNTFYDHKDIHRITREERNRNEKSIIDYIITDKNQRRNVQDVRVMRSYEIGSDHYLVVAKLKIQGNPKNSNNNETNRTNNKVNINTYKLKNTETREAYQEAIKAEIAKIKEVNTKNIEEIWSLLKKLMKEAGKKACGVTKMGSNKKQTHWWNEEIKKEVKEKKQKWNKYLSTHSEEDYGKYKEQRKKAKEMIVRAKRINWDEFGTQMETNHKENQKLFFRVIKRQRTEKKPPLKQIKDKNGKIIQREEDIMKRWKEHFEELLEANGSEASTDSATNTNEEEAEQENNDEEITIREIEDAMKGIKTGKAAGIDDIKPEQLKYIGDEGVKIIHILFNLIWNVGKIPKDWETAVIIPIYKKGDNRVCSNYRGISLLCTTAKLYEKILENRARQKIEQTLELSQSGFRRGHSTQDHVFSIRQIIEKTLEYNRETNICFIDLVKAFDRVPREHIWKVLKDRGISNKLRKAIQSLYTTTRNYIRTGNTISEEFKTVQGLRQGGTLSPLLFILMLDEVMKQISNKTKKLGIGNNKLQRITITESAYADDLAIFGKTEQDLQHNIDVWNEQLQKVNMQINTEKTKVMHISKEERTINIIINGETIEQVDRFKYLGSMIENRGGYEEEINNRLQATAKTFHALNKVILSNKNIKKKTKMTIYKTIYQPVMLFGCETWVTNKRQESKLQAAEMKYLRRVEGLKKQDKVKSEEIRTNLEIKPAQRKIEEKQLQWYGHLLRMNDNRLAKRIWKARTQGKRSRGRPRKTWDNAIDEILMKKGIDRKQAKTIAANRKDWLKLTKE